MISSNDEMWKCASTIDRYEEKKNVIRLYTIYGDHGMHLVSQVNFILKTEYIIVFTFYHD